jgi:N-acetylneuraminic acid mutarotase
VARRDRRWIGAGIAALAVVSALVPAAFSAKEGEGGGIFVPTGAMVTGRVGHTATLLRDGRVLVTGGEDLFGHGLATAELYDPSSNRWRRTGAMSSARGDHAAALLPDGRVLVTGGFPTVTGGDLESVATAEIYDPRTERWSPAAPMAYPRARHTATLLRNGKVLVVGGVGPISTGFTFWPVAELYDPARNSWETLPGRAPACEGHSAILLSSGKVFLVGGETDLGADTAPRLYDPSADAWTELQETVARRAGATATLMPRDRVLLLGGVSVTVSPASYEILTSGELYDPVQGRSRPVAPMPDPHEQHTATLLLTGRVLVVGGVYDVTPAILYDPAANRWEATGAPLRRYGHTATLLQDGRVLIAGGYRAPETAIVYDPAGGTTVVEGGLARVAAIVLLVAVLAAAAGLLILAPAVRRLRAWRAVQDPDRWIE